MKNRRKNKLVKLVGREYRGLLALGSLLLTRFVIKRYNMLGNFKSVDSVIAEKLKEENPELDSRKSRTFRVSP